MPLKQTVEIPFKNLSPMYGNPRTISAEKLEALKASLLKFGYVDPIIVDENDVILGGNQRYQALKDVIDSPEGLIDVVRISGLSEDDKKALNIALNNISGENDEEKLDNWLDELYKAGYDFSGAGINDILDNYDYDSKVKIENNNYTADVELDEDDEENTEQLIIKFSNKNEKTEAAKLFSISKNSKSVHWDEIKRKIMSNKVTLTV